VVDGGGKAVLTATRGHEHGAVDVVNGGGVALPLSAVVGCALVAKGDELTDVGEHLHIQDATVR
jgi:hypothetical protein